MSLLAIQANTDKRPRKLVDFIIEFNDSDSVETITVIWEVLCRLYGNSDTISDQLFNELNEFPVLSSPGTFLDFEHLLDICWKIYLNIPHCPKLKSLNTGSEIKQIIEKLPLELGRQWIEIHKEYEFVCGAEPKFLVFLHFLNEKFEEIFPHSSTPVKLKNCKI